MPRYQNLGRAPLVDPSAWVAPTAVLCGEVRVGPGCAISHGAVLDAGDGTIQFGRECVVMENAVIKTGQRAPVRIGDHVLVGPRAYLTGWAWFRSGLHAKRGIPWLARLWPLSV